MTIGEHDAVRLLVIGAHPDDCEVRVGGLAALYRRRDWRVTFVSLTNGDAGHHTLDRPALAARRLAETRAVSQEFGIDYHVLDNHDGELEATLANRQRVIRLIRTCQPDLVLTHRPNDYHPDHRYAATLVQDAAFSITVPLICPDVPVVAKHPVFGYFQDAFTIPTPFYPTVVVDISAVMDRKMAMLHCHASQFYEWLPFHAGKLAQVPAGEAERRQFLETHWQHRSSPEPWRSRLAELYGETRAQAVRYAEAIEISEYGAPLDAATRQRLFPF